MREQDLILTDISLQLVIMVVALHYKCLRHTKQPQKVNVYCWSFTRLLLIAGKNAQLMMVTLKN